jgi:hypothetical protein
MKKRKRFELRRFFLALPLLLVVPLAGCSSSGDERSDTGSVGFCNYTADVYDLELRRVADDAVIRTLTLGPGAGGDPNCAEETEITVGSHYVVAFRRNDVYFDESPDFLVLHQGTRPTVRIIGVGEIEVDGGDTRGYGDIEVCNFDNREYLVTLRRELDDEEVARFELNPFFAGYDVCDEFRVIPSGVYYLKIFRLRDTDRQATSPIFFLTDGETEEFAIDSGGDIVNVD